MQGSFRDSVRWCRFTVGMTGQNHVTSEAYIVPDIGATRRCVSVRLIGIEPVARMVQQRHSNGEGASVLAQSDLLIRFQMDYLRQANPELALVEVVFAAPGGVESDKRDIFVQSLTCEIVFFRPQLIGENSERFCPFRIGVEDCVV